MISIIVPSHAMSAVRGDEPTGTTADKMCQSPKRDSWVTTVLVDEVMSEGDEDSMSCFSQPDRVKSTDIQRIKILKFLQLGGDFFQCRFSGRLAACRQGVVGIYLTGIHHCYLRFIKRKSTKIF